MAVWDDSLGQPRLVELPEICRKPEADDPHEAPRLVPSAVHLIERPGLLDRLGSWRPIARRLFIGQRALVGRPALERNYGVVHPSFVPTFKPALSTESLRPLARVGRHSVTAREAVRAFLRELLREVKRSTGRRPRDLVVTSPVSAFETYRAEVQGILHEIGARRVRFVHEPVAAALGYGLSLTHERAREILHHSLRTWRQETARACLEALGRSGGDDAVDLLAKVMQVEGGELALAAVRALGWTDMAGAEGPLLEALARDSAALRVAAARALGYVGTVQAVLPLKEAETRYRDDKDLHRAARQAIADIQSRLSGAAPGQLSLAEGEAGQLSLAESETGQLSLAKEDEKGRLSLESIDASSSECDRRGRPPGSES